MTQTTSIQAGATSVRATPDHASQLIDGRWVDGESVRDVVDPGNGELVGTLTWGTAQDAVNAADSAARAFDDWASKTGRYRADILRDAADLLDRRAPDLSITLAREAGKRLPEAQGEIAFSAEYLRWFAEEARRVPGSVITPESGERRHLTISRPAGVALSLTPWNFPVSIQARKIAPMLAAGCTVVARASEKTPLAVTELFRALTDAGVPRGVLNLVQGPARELTSALIDHESVRVLSFTGSTEVGSAIMARAARRIVRPLLELGGNAPFLVFEDADIDAAVEGAVLARLRNTGQSCVAANRFLVHRSMADEFGERLAARFDAMTIGHGMPGEDGVVPDLGPMISAERVAAVQSLIDNAVADGAELLTRRTAVPASGAFLAPTLLRCDAPGSRILSEEVFGPAAAILAFDDDDQALAIANDTEMGLASYIFTNDPQRIWRFAENLDAGIVGVNDPLPSVAFAPMGGTKLSGIGREGASVGMEEFLETRHVAWR
jgi:succinate-semialdehyde dehydrogenase/glutarate-semialdehyde dehydrogenase